jgi:hypothetical protein
LPLGVVACLLPVASGCGSKDKATKEVEELILGKWQHEKGNTLSTLAFAAGRVKIVRETNGIGWSKTDSYRVVNSKTLGLPNLGESFEEEEVTIDSVTKDRLVLSGGQT